MRNVGMMLMLSIISVGCAGTSASNMTEVYTSGSKDHELIEVVAMDTDCNNSKISILKRHDTAGFGNYRILACGKKLKYKRTGSVFHAANKRPY